MEDPVRGQPYVKMKGRWRPEIHDSAGSFRPYVEGIHRSMRDSEVYDDIATILSSALPLSFVVASST